MSAIFRVGQQVICVRGPYADWLWPGARDVVVGETYTIVRIVTDTIRPQFGIGLWVAERPEDGGFYSSRFRPIVKTDISALTALLNPANHKQREGV